MFFSYIVPTISVTMNRIKEVLKEKGIKQIWLADKLGKSFNMVNSYVQNRQQPRLEVLYKIAEILNIEAKELLVETKAEIVGVRVLYSAAFKNQAQT